MKHEKKKADKPAHRLAADVNQAPGKEELGAQFDARLTKLWALVSPDACVYDEHVRQALDYLVVQATKMPLGKVDKTVAETFALLFWYRNEDMRESLEHRLSSPGVAPVRKRRLMYLVDRLRRFPCMRPEQAEQMKMLVTKWQDLTRNLNDRLVQRAKALNEYDKVAVTWGVAEPVGHVMGMVLELQTRHFADAHHLPSGYPELSTQRDVGHR
ncbi:hypothetical protein [Pseudomonas putida]|uniref:hypothetical protein n=1 Tax=Pseudomonas putida TaxID=303 RepID=UPI001EE2C82F|nr:hypothetical protein [Pseudomonas putida]